ncbi:MAG: class I tRNA ligase family protein, partial [Methanoregulaceae archaeon]|nr:class I tRNA ligase family protein [Methanoregulaceae archaeon]
WIRLLAPFVPYTTEKLWQECGGTGMVAFAPWPTADDTKVQPHLETREELLMRTVEDIESICKLIQITPASITLYTAPSWKWDLFRKIASAPDRTQVVKEVMKDAGMRKRGKAATMAITQITTLIHRLGPDLVAQLRETPIHEKEFFEASREFLRREFGVPVHVIEGGEGMHPKAGGAIPFKPAIVIE